MSANRVNSKEAIERAEAAEFKLAEVEAELRDVKHLLYGECAAKRELSKVMQEVMQGKYHLRFNKE